MYRTIVAGCNGRERGRGAVSLAHAISSATGARLLLAGVQYADALQELIDPRLTAAQDLLARRLEACDGAAAGDEVTAR